MKTTRKKNEVELERDLYHFLDGGFFDASNNSSMSRELTDFILDNYSVFVCGTCYDKGKIYYEYEVGDDDNWEYCYDCDLGRGLNKEYEDRVAERIRLQNEAAAEKAWKDGWRPSE